ncbi:HAD family phosphatase [Roseibaca sp. V10]|uniref:phosphoglycolate phosphatase n=1 Tax=Roseinatronobacter domitianus TaxID=2940293 RepID=A0ABT0M580_9RHOB|nr:HAD family phosphatase [Roseibaca domitiana]MCL1629813.1 HAD family phosphatase [Roseibaca domitiana]
MTPELVIFDCDGVLVDSEPVTLSFLRDELALRGLDLTLAEVIDQFIGGTLSGVAQKARGMGANLPEGWVDAFYARLYERLAAKTDLMPGVVPLLDRLDAAGIGYCVASNGRVAKMQVTLGQHPNTWARLQGRIFSVEHVGVPKPAPDLFLYAARSLGVEQAHCVVIEDSQTGARAAKAAGMRCFGYAPEGDGAKLATEGAHVFRSMDDLPDLLGL